MRMIERWFPCQEVSEAAAGGWGSGKSEKALFPWFAARPLAQAKAAVLTSLLPWPADPAEQRRLQDLIRHALTGRDAAHHEITKELLHYYPNGASLLDPFSGRAMIPLEASRLGVRTWGIDYSPVAALAGQLLADYPMRDWSAEPELPLSGYSRNQMTDRLLADVCAFLNEVGRRYTASMAAFYPSYNGRLPWGYLWAVTLPCQECGRRFPLTGSLVLRHPLPAKGDRGESYEIVVDKQRGSFRAEVHPGEPHGKPTLVLVGRSSYSSKGKAAVCPFCEHVHPKDVHTRLIANGQGQDVLLVAADQNDDTGKSFRTVTQDEHEVIKLAEHALTEEPSFAPGIPAVPNEQIPPGNTWTVQPTVYGAKVYGDLCNARQTLGFVRLCRIVGELSQECRRSGISLEYSAALCSYAASVIARKLKYSTRGADLQLHRAKTSNTIQVGHIFGNSESSISFSYDYFETGIGTGAGTWVSLSRDTEAILRNQAGRFAGCAARIQRGSALSLPFKNGTIDSVVTDPPYESMIDYSDVSDLFYVWIKRALIEANPEFAITTHPMGVQEKADEIIVKKGGSSSHDHRTKAHYDKSITSAFCEAARVLRPEGVVTIVFGHGEPEVWRRLLGAISAAGLFLTGSWPARTEKGGKAGSANIVTTLTLACRRAPAVRPIGRVNEVDQEVRSEVHARIPLWEAAGLALTDQLMAAAGPALEVVGRYSAVLDVRGQSIDPGRYLVLARKAVEEAANIRVDGLPLESFDARTRFALFWSRLYGRAVAPKSEAIWQAFAVEKSLGELVGILVEPEGAKGVRLAYSDEVRPDVRETSSVIDVAFALAAAWPEGLDAVAAVLQASGREVADEPLRAAITYLSARVAEGDRDRQAWDALIRGRGGVASAVHGAAVTSRRMERDAVAHRVQGALFDLDSLDSGGKP